MARRALAVAPGLGAAVLAAALILVPLAAVLPAGRGHVASRPGRLGGGALHPDPGGAFRRAVRRPRDPGRARPRPPPVSGGAALCSRFCGAPFILPVIVAVLGLLAVFGRAGILSQALGLLGLPPVPIYGLHGVVLAHVFFNLPLATRLILQGWLAIPAERFRLAASLGIAAGRHHPPARTPDAARHPSGRAARHLPRLH